MGHDLGHRRAPELPGSAHLLPGRLPAADDGRRAGHPLGSTGRRASRSNDTIRWGNWSFNAGDCSSATTRSTAGLRRTSRHLRVRAAVGNKYKMYEIPLGRCCSRVSAPRGRYNGNDTVYASYARYSPAASSLPRAASWDRNVAVTIRAYFDQNGVLFGNDPLASSSGKLFCRRHDPRTVDEYLVGTARQFNSQWSRTGLLSLSRGQPLLGGHETNDARVRFNPPEASRASCTSPTWRPSARRSAALVVRHRRARRGLHEVPRG